MNADLSVGDQIRERATRAASEDLLRAQLTAGQHILTHATAVLVGRSVGLRACAVRAAAGDPTITQGAQA
ncbi:hypothetical protein [Sphingomonas sp. IC4-52]|uniref:hypothetical protein n=1 Tax=Sphingomonas sp. IC4-52 TaxID=2887202 RepID=UPI001D12C7F0|nr:hypothetical protein [Sphingomonas sp. IC4-52]MCC2978820.1 hypothetical protein [Sphingomonas sp. IC4-52]